MFPAGGTLDSAVALCLKYLIKQQLGSAIIRALAAQKDEHDKRIEAARESKSVNDWLMRLADVLPLTDAQYLIHRCLVQLVRQRHLADEELAPYGLSFEGCKEEEKRLDEDSAYTYSSGISQYKDNPDTACLLYLAKIAEKAQHEGSRVAKRQTRNDLARFMIPRFLMDDACDAIDG
jgi:hypothetical protein